MPRIPFPDSKPMSPDQQRVYDSVVAGPRGRIVGPLRAALHNAELADHWQKMGALLRYGTSLSKRHSELAILVTGRAMDCPFEWSQHEGPAREAGLPDPAIDAMRTGAAPQFDDPADEAIYQFANQLHRDKTVSEATHRAVSDLYGPKGAVELTALVGYYTLVAMTLNAHDFALPDGLTDPFAHTPRPGANDRDRVATVD